MERRKIEVLQYRGVCKNKHHFTLYGLPDFSYGQKPARTPEHDDFSVLDCSGDQVCEELGVMVSHLLGNPDKDDWRRPFCFEVCLGVASDPAPSGYHYDFTGRVWCPVCRSVEVKYGVVTPDIWETLDVPLITHTRWLAMGQDEKLDRLRAVLQEAGCLLDTTTSEAARQ